MNMAKEEDNNNLKNLSDSFASLILPSSKFLDGSDVCDNKEVEKENSEKISDHLNNCRTLETLNLSHRQLSIIPAQIDMVCCLTELDLSHNLFSKFPNAILVLSSLKKIDLSYNSLSELPDNVNEIKYIQSLSLAHNKFKEVPAQFLNQLTQLKHLDLSYNKLLLYDGTPGFCTTISEIDLSGNAFLTIPAWIFNATCRLKTFKFNMNEVKEIKIEGNVYNIGPFQTISKMELQNCCLSCKMLNFLRMFKGLVHLDLSNNCRRCRNSLYDLSIHIFEKCTNLRYLSVKDCQLSLLPLNFGNLNLINTLDLSLNSLSWLPDSFCNLQSLEVCNLSSNMITFLPVDFGKLVNLKVLIVHDNYLYQLPKSLKNCKNLEYADFYSNEIGTVELDFFNDLNFKGVDFELNCINWQYEVSEIVQVQEFMKKYEQLRSNFRQWDRNAADRELKQKTIEKSETEDESDGHPVDESYEENSYADAEERVEEPECWDEGQVSNQADGSSTEYGSGNSTLHETDNSEILVEMLYGDDLFDPNELVDTRVKLAAKRAQTKKMFRGNYCPAVGHARSHRKKHQLAVVPPVDGQFDLD